MPALSVRLIGMAVAALLVGAVAGAAFMSSSLGPEIDSLRQESNRKSEMIEQLSELLSRREEEIGSLRDELAKTQAAVSRLSEELERKVRELESVEAEAVQLDELEERVKELSTRELLIKEIFDVSSNNLAKELAEAINAWAFASSNFGAGQYDRASASYEEAAFWMERAVISQRRIEELHSKLVELAPDDESYVKASRIARHDTKILESLRSLLSASSKVSAVLAEMSKRQNATEEERAAWLSLLDEAEGLLNESLESLRSAEEIAPELRKGVEGRRSEVMLWLSLVSLLKERAR